MEASIRDAATPGGRIRVELRGTGTPVLLLHGLSAHRRTWDAVLPRLEGRFRLCAPDLPGRGESEPRPELAHGLTEELGTLRHALVAVGFVPRIAVGHSHGSALALALAAVDPRVRGVVLLNPVHPWTRRPAALSLLRVRGLRRPLARLLVPLRNPLARRILRRTYGPNRRATERDVTRYAAPYADPVRARLLLRALADWEPAALERHLPRRVLAGRVLAGGHDRRIGRRGPARLAARLGLEFASVPGAGHALPEEAPEAVARAVVDVATSPGAADEHPSRENARAAP